MHIDFLLIGLVSSILSILSAFKLLIEYRSNVTLLNVTARMI